MRTVTAMLMLGATVFTNDASGEITLLVDPNLSMASVELCLLGDCDSDSSQVAGQLVIDLGSPVGLTEITLFDYEFLLIDPLMFNIGNVLGSLDVLVEDASLFYPTPGVPIGPVPIAGDGMFTFFQVPAAGSGIAAYEATGLTCVVFANQGLPCDGLVDLSTLGVSTLNELTGTISISQNVVTVEIEAAGVLPLVPGSADLTFVVSVVATGMVPITQGDADQDGDIDVFDFEQFIDCRQGPGSPPAKTCGVFDFDSDGDVDFDDFGAFQIVFTGGG